MSQAAAIEALELLGAKRLAFVTPDGDAYQAKVEKNLAEIGRPRSADD